MKNYLFFALGLLYILNFTACATKTQEEVSSSNTKDVSNLLRKVIQREKEINELNKELENCKESKSTK